MADDRPIDGLRCEALAARAASGDAAAARALVEELWPHWVRLARASRALRAAPSIDEAALEVATRMAEKLGRPGAHELSRYPVWKERNEEKSFDDWVRIVTANVARDLARELLGPAPRAEGPPSLKRVLNDLAQALPVDDVGVRPPVTAAQTARELLDFARQHLPETQRRSLALWLEGASFDDIAIELSLESPLEGQRAVRAAVATLRRRFADAQ